MEKTINAQDHSTQLPYIHGVFLVILAGVFWSSIGIGIRLIEHANVWQILIYRSFSLAVFLFTLISFRSGFKPVRQIRRSGWAGIIGGFGLVMAFAGGIYSIQTTTVANAMFLFSSAPFIAATLGWLILGETVNKTTWLSMLVALTGIAVMVAHGISAGHMVGNLCAILSALGFAIFSIALRWGKIKDMLPAVFLAGIFAMSIAITVCVLQSYSLLIPVRDMVIALSMGIFQVGVGLAVFTIGSKVVPAVELTLLSMTEVLLGPFWVWLFIGEAASMYTLTGGMIVLMAITANAIFGIRRNAVPVY